MRLLRIAILILSLFMLIPANAQDETVELTWQERRAIRQQGNWDEAVRRIAEVAETNAVELDLSNLSLIELPPQFYELTQLEIVDFSGNLLRNWSSDIGNFINLRQIDLSYNNIISPTQHGDERFRPLFVLPDEFYELPQLEVHLINSIPPKIGQLHSLRVLDLSFNERLATLPDELANLSNLEVLYYDGVTDGAIPEVIFQLSNLRELSITGRTSDIELLPATIENLTQLEILNLPENSIAELPPEISSLANLHTLDLNHNSLMNLPDVISQIPNLRVLNINGNEISELPSEIGNLVNLQELHLNGNYLSVLPNTIGNLVNLEVLDLGFNDITAIPSTIGNLTQLRELDLTQNLLESIPSEIGQLDKLEVLYLIANNITELPPEIGNLSSLTHLHLRENSLTALPDEIGNLSRLEVLSLGSRYHIRFVRERRRIGNQITELPASIGRLKNLRQLWLSRNPIETLPRSIGHLRNLEYLDLEYTSIGRIPYSVADMNDELRIRLYVDDETQLFPPVEIWWGNTGDVQHYLWWHRFWWWRALPVGIVVGLYAFYRLIGWLWMRRQGAFVGKKKKKREA